MASGYHMKQGRSRHTGSPQHLFALFLAELNVIILKIAPKFCFWSVHLRMSAGDTVAPTWEDISSVIAVTGQRQSAFSERASQVALVVKNPPSQCRRQKGRGFNPWVRKIPWRRAQQPIPVFLLKESLGQRSLAGHSPWGRRVGHNWSDLVHSVCLYA